MRYMSTEKTIRTAKSRNSQNCMINGWAKMRFIPLIECSYTGECDKKMPLGKKGTFCRQSSLEQDKICHNASGIKPKSLVGKIFRRYP